MTNFFSPSLPPSPVSLKDIKVEGMRETQRTQLVSDEYRKMVFSILRRHSELELGKTDTGSVGWERAEGWAKVMRLLFLSIRGQKWNRK